MKITFWGVNRKIFKMNYLTVRDLAVAVSTFNDPFKPSLH